MKVIFDQNNIFSSEWNYTTWEQKQIEIKMLHLLKCVYSAVTQISLDANKSRSDVQTCNTASPMNSFPVWSAAGAKCQVSQINENKIIKIIAHFIHGNVVEMAISVSAWAISENILQLWERTQEKPDIWN